MMCDSNVENKLNDVYDTNANSYFKNDNRLGITGGQVLNSHKLLALFQGSQENVDYFQGLWMALNNDEDDNRECNIDDDKKEIDINSRKNDDGKKSSLNWNKFIATPSDPRDEKKRNRVVADGWRQTVRVCPLDDAVDGDDVDGDDGAVGVVEKSCGISTSSRYVVKQTTLNSDGKGDGGGDSDSMTEFNVDSDGQNKRYHCGVDGCGQVSNSLASYENHYRHCHSFVCSVCRRVFVSHFLLDIHLQENHDSYFDLLSSRIDMYRCLVESCCEKFRSPVLRKDHMVRVHKYPASFSFHQPVNQHQHDDTRSNKDKRKKKNAASQKESPMNIEESSSSSSSLLISSSSPSSLSSPSVQPTTVCGSGTETENNTNGRHVAMETKSCVTVQPNRVPTSICFGRGSQRAFQHRRGRGGRGRNWFQEQQQSSVAMATDTRVDIEAVDMMDLVHALT